MVVLWRRYEDFISESRPSGLRAMVPFRRADCSGGRTHHALYSMTRFSHDLELAKWSGVKSDVPERVPLESTRHLCGRHRHWTCLLQRDPLQPRSSGAARTGSDHPEPLSWVLRIGPCKDEGLERSGHGKSMDVAVRIYASIEQGICPRLCRFGASHINAGVHILPNIHGHGVGFTPWRAAN